MNHFNYNYGLKGIGILVWILKYLPMRVHFDLYNYYSDLTPSLSLPLQLSVSEVISEIQVCATLNTSSINEIDIDVTLATSDGTGTYVQNLTVSCT